MAYEIFHEDPEAEGGRAGLPAGDDRADAVRLRHRAAPPAHRRRARDARGVPRAGRAAPGAPRSAPARREQVGHYPVHVRFSDVDVYGHVNNVKYFEYLQEARILYTARLWRDDRRGARPVAMVVAQTDVEYRRPDPVPPRALRLLVVDLPRRRRRSMIVESEICDGDAVLSRARVVMVFFDRETAAPADPPAGAARAAARRPGRRGSLQRVDHELRRVGDVVPELRVLLRRQLDGVEARPEVPQPVVLGLRGHRERRVPHPQPRVAALSEYVVGPPQYCTRKSRNRSSAGPRSSSGYSGRSTSSSATPS